jgi:2-dehydro-3-deoxyphosphogluconate aldolase/(4S)-4-hydroxy-2-oxoglutarate aldolase
VAENAGKIAALVKEYGSRMAIGAGTVLSVDEVRAAHDAGATFIVSPDSDPEVIAETKRLGMASIPGAMTPTEIKRAYALGADIVKLFPADDLGYHYIQNLKGPMPHIPLMATGGVNPDTIPEFLSRGILAVGTGITIFRPDLVATEDYAGIAALAKAHIDAIRNAV